MTNGFQSKIKKLKFWRQNWFYPERDKKLFQSSPIHYEPSVFI